MAEKFEPIKVESVPKEDIKDFKVDFEEKSLGELGKENTYLSSYLNDQKAGVEKHLATFKKKALDKYTGVFVVDNEKAVNQAMADFAKEMNKILEESTADLQVISDKYEKAKAPGASSAEFHEHFKNVAKEFGPVLERKILLQVNGRISQIIDAAEGRAGSNNIFGTNADKANEVLRQGD